MSKMNGFDALIYLFQPEDSTGTILGDTLCQNATPSMKVAKTVLWLGVALVLSMGISTLI